MSIKWKSLEELYRVTKESDKRFHMGWFRAKGTEDDVEPVDVFEDNLNCGTICCLLGHGPLSTKLAPPTSCFSLGRCKGDQRKLDWDMYAEKVFGIPCSSSSLAWDFLFDSEWAENPKTRTKKQALKRLELFIKNKGVPKEWLDSEDPYDMVF